MVARTYPIVNPDNWTQKPANTGGFLCVIHCVLVDPVDQF